MMHAVLLDASQLYHGIDIMQSDRKDNSGVAAATELSKARKIYLMLSERIASGALPAGSRIASEPALAAEHGVSRVTIRRALDRLESEGRVSRRAGAGTFVAGGAVQPVVRAGLTDVFARMREMGEQTGVRLLSFAYVTPPDAIAEALGLAPGERTQRAVRVRLVDSQPFSYLTTHVPERIGATYTEADLAARPLLALLERSGIEADHASQTVGAVLAGPEVADALQVDIGAALLSLTRLVTAADGTGIEHLHGLYRPDRFVFTMDLTKDTPRRGKARA
jgi:GntR family transcriptional regulator